ncbi:N-acetylmuramoyl-L-alanine amidase [Terrimonas sp. NA20]|uniref:N-acetylmuramoyl-L-alanine amidase n=1 Tax=Terrimonas ginsenosidimutans TaxID=2908004 RepID=A0ABS9KNR7_9BACT|nr:N-acetylmuramoyl-L-alanine amidase [Terrimonas ginsenosidimutans]MCG2613934.1 N-acetylmuramoyl-L-alanine amidase [Terrimonas ginsenosidimutans]
MKYFFIPGCLVMLMMAACSPSSKTNKEYRKQAKEYARILQEYPVRDSAGLNYAGDWVGTTNFSMRRPNFVVIHHTAQNSCEQTLKTFTIPRTQVSAHYVICKDGTVHHMLNDLLRAHHAGVSKWGNNADLNSSSVGIEIDNNGVDSFSNQQMMSLLVLLGRLKRAYNIPTANFIGHADIAPGRKVDPNRTFPWQRLAEQGYGYWYDTTGVQVPADFNPVQALRIIGYTIQKPESAIASFKLHFVPSDSSIVITEEERKILFSLQKKYE